MNLLICAAGVIVVAMTPLFARLSTDIVIERLLVALLKSDDMAWKSQRDDQDRPTIA